MPFLFGVFFKDAPLTLGYAADAEAKKRWHPTKDTKEVLMPTPVPVATSIVCVQCLLLSLALSLTQNGARGDDNELATAKFSTTQTSPANPPYQKKKGKVMKAKETF